MLTQKERPDSAPAALALWLPVALYMAVIFAASSLSKPPVPAEIPDYSLHEAAYAGLTLVTIRALARGRWSGVTTGVLAGAWTIAVLYGVTDEFHQSFVPQRTAELRDLRSDAIGALAAVAAVKAWGIIRRL